MKTNLIQFLIEAMKEFINSCLFFTKSFKIQQYEEFFFNLLLAFK